MGGIGSTRWEDHQKKHTVADCISLDLAALRRAGVLQKHALKRGVLTSKIVTWSRNGIETDRIGFWIDTTDEAGFPHVRLHYHVGSEGQVIDELFEVSYHQTKFSGERAWLLCQCGKRIRALHKPPNSSRFRCRHCHDLTYKSCQESHTGGLMGKMHKALTRAEKTNELLKKCHIGSKRWQQLQQRFDREHKQLNQLDHLRAQLHSPEQYFQRVDQLNTI